MGTSKPLAGPRGSKWNGAGQRFSRWGQGLAGSDGAQAPSDASVERLRKVGEAYRQALADALAASPNEFGLRDALTASGARLLAVLDQLAVDGVTALGSLDGNDADERLDVFAARFADAVVGLGGGLVDAVIRQAVAGRILDTLAAPDTPVGKAIRDGSTGGTPIVGELLCTIYQLFFADCVSGFFKAVIAEKIKLVVPALYAVDPASIVANWISGQIVSLLPSPCEQQHTSGSDSLSDIARGLLHESVDRALGLPTARQAAA